MSTFPEQKENQNKYKHGLHFYNTLPTFTADLEILKTLCLDRLQLFLDLDLFGIELYKTTESSEYIKNARRKTYYYLLSLESDQQMEWDDISHNILTLAFCNQLEKMIWFVKMEVNLFLYRFSKLSIEAVNNFLHLNELQLQLVSNESRSLLLDILTTYDIKDKNIDDIAIYKVPFEKVLFILNKGDVFLHNGYTYILDRHLKHFASEYFANILQDKLKFLEKRFSFLQDERINNIIKFICNTYEKYDFRKAEVIEIITDASKLDEASIYFPPCMRNIHLHFRNGHHMNYFMRMQYGIFLKSLGLPLEQTIEFWKEEFTKIMSHEQFLKKYLYAIKYIYGLVGRRANFKCYSCKQIVNNDTYKDYKINCGCTFAHRHSTEIREMLLENNLCNREIVDIEDSITKGSYTKACAKFFNYVHGSTIFDNIENPCEYYEKSVEHHLPSQN